MGWNEIIILYVKIHSGSVSLTLLFRRITPSEVHFKVHLRSLQDEIQEDKVNYFNIDRQNILDGAVRAIKRKTFQPLARIDVKFSDSYGCVESVIDAGGPTREFLRLLIHAVMRSSVFESSTDARILSRNETGMTFLSA